MVHKINILAPKSQILKKSVLLLIFYFLFPNFSDLLAQNNETGTLIKVEGLEVPSLEDSGDMESLKKALTESLAYLEAAPPESPFYFGKESYGKKEVQESLLQLKKFLKKKRSKKKLAQFIKKNFYLYRADTVGPKNGVTFSSYYEYGLSASLVPTEEFRYPLYGRPPELIDAPLEKFDPKKRGERVVGKVVGRELQPYYTREEIDSYQNLKGRGLEIAWAKDPLEILFLQIQGSGWIVTPEGKTYHIRYTGDNGHPYRSVGLNLIQKGILTKENFSRQKMIDALTQMSEEKRQSFLNINPRYVFFEIVSDTVPIRGSLSVPLTAGRSIASDPKYYPPGAMAWIHTLKPIFDKDGNKIGAEEMRRFVFNQDEGGAIKGPHRIDFFSGKGPEAKKMAENLWYPGEIYLLIIKK